MIERKKTPIEMNGVQSRKPVNGIAVAVLKTAWIMIKNFFRGIISPKYWIKIIFLVLLSTLINLVRAGATGIEFFDSIASSDTGGKIFGALSFLLYSGGGVSKNAGKIVTGTLAKTICAAFIVSILSGKMKGTFKGIKLMTGSLLGKYKRPSKALVGAGFALIVYAVISGQSGYAGIMVVISMVAGTLRALGGNGQILRTLAASLNSYKIDKVRRANLTNMNAMLAGCALGCLLSYSANGIFGQIGCAIVGMVLVAAGIVFGIPTRAKSKAEVIV